MPPPPKYEGEEEDREAEEGGAGQAVDAESVVAPGASGSGAVVLTGMTDEAEGVVANGGDIGEVGLGSSVPIARRESRDL